jgi:hypothetical protein
MLWPLAIGHWQFFAVNHAPNTNPASSVAFVPPPAKPPLSPRRRKLRWTLVILSCIAVASFVTGFVIYRETRPPPYHPDEQVAEITSSLTRHFPPEAPKPYFTDMTRQAGLSAFRTFLGQRTSQLPEDNGPGAAWGDFDNDGDDDLFLVSAGGPLNVPTEKLAPCELAENLGRGKFRKVESFPELRLYGMAAAWGDYDGDGYLDLIVTGYNALLLFHNEQGTGGFTRDPHFPDRKGIWAGAAWGDYDNDGAMDILLVHPGEGVQLLRNEMQTGHWLKLRLRSLLKNGKPLGHGDGTKVIAYVGGMALRRAVTGVSYLSQNTRTLHFGLGQAKQVDRLEVRWHAGATNFFDNLEADATWEITEGVPAPKRVALPSSAAGAGGLPASQSSSNTASRTGAQANLQAGKSALPDERARILKFWSKQRAAMNALKVEKDFAKATQLFYETLALDPKHEDSRYYLAWKRGTIDQAQKLLQDTRQALGNDWQPKGATFEGDVHKKQHIETTPLTRFWEGWDGVFDPAKTYTALDAHLTRPRP